MLYYAAYLIPLIRFAVVPIKIAMDERNKSVFSASIYSLDSQIELYHLHNAFVRQAVPKDKKFEYNPNKGYEPLCEFLNVPVPTDERGNKLESPHANDSESMQQGFKFAIVMGCAIWCVVIGGAYAMIRSIALFMTQSRLFHLSIFCTAINVLLAYRIFWERV